VKGGTVNILYRLLSGGTPHWHLFPVCQNTQTNMEWSWHQANYPFSIWKSL